jgi:hypothetical protein
MGVDVYAIHVRVENPGPQPVRFDPAGFRLSYAGESIALITANDSRFLQAMSLASGESAEGLRAQSEEDHCAQGSSRRALAKTAV